MGEPKITEGTVREYLLRRITDEATLEAVEELMFTDDQFCNQVALAADGLINDYVLGKLSAADSARFEETLTTDQEWRRQTSFTQEIRKRALAEDAALMPEASMRAARTQSCSLAKRFNALPNSRTIPSS